MSAPKGGETIFAEALRLRPEERAAYIAQSTLGNPELRQEVESLLESYRAGEFLEHAAAPELRPTLVSAAAVTEKAGDTIGRYKLLQQIGEGGCGVVYMAEQLEPVRRRVALKIIKLGMDTKSVIGRFEAERQALALMDHPNIAKVFDAGATDTGRPYFVMELVRGRKITEYCDEKKLSTRERLDLFIQICKAIQHAHQKGIIHRDIKPSNILVSIDDGLPVPKVIDFGIAKATSGQQLTNRTLFTAFEQFIGTPAYMSPEQAMLTNVDVDTRSDIYALGVLLYELLTGKTPFDAQELLAIGLDEMRRTIREQEPPRPSTRLSTLPGQELSTTAHRRGLDAPRLVSELRGDLDWIVMKALEKDRSRRYETANGLAADIQRHLHNEPVVACPPSNLYRFQKMARRNKAEFVASIAVFVALVAGVAISSWMFLKEREARTRAVAAEEQERKLRQHAELRELKTAAFQLQSQLIDRDVRVSAWRKAIEAQQKLLGKDHPDVADSLEQIAGIHQGREGWPQAEKLQREALEIRRRNSPTGDVRLGQSLHKLASLLMAEEKWPEAEKALSEALEIRRRVQGEENIETVMVMNDLAVAVAGQNKSAEALAFYRKSFPIARKLLPDGHSLLGLQGFNLIRTLLDEGHADEAIELIRGFVPGNEKAHPGLFGMVNRVRALLLRERKDDQLEQLLNDLVSKAPGNRNLLWGRAEVLKVLGRYEAASSDYRHLIELKSEDVTRDAWFWHEQALLLAILERKEQLEEHAREHLNRFANSPNWQSVEMAVKSTLLLPGFSDNTRHAIKLAEGLTFGSSEHAGWIAVVKGMAEYRRGAFQAALDHLRRACQEFQPAVCRAQAFPIAAMAHYRLGRLEEARAAYAWAKDLESYGRRKSRHDLDWASDWLRVSVLLREASGLIEGAPKRVQAVEPADGASLATR